MRSLIRQGADHAMEHGAAAVLILLKIGGDFKVMLQAMTRPLIYANTATAPPFTLARSRKEMVERALEARTGLVICAGVPQPELGRCWKRPSESRSP